MTSDTALCSSLKVGAEPEALYIYFIVNASLEYRIRKGMRQTDQIMKVIYNCIREQQWNGAVAKIQLHKKCPGPFLCFIHSWMLNTIGCQRNSGQFSPFNGMVIVNQLLQAYILQQSCNVRSKLTELQCVTVLDGYSMSECTGMPNCLVFIHSSCNIYIQQYM